MLQFKTTELSSYSAPEQAQMAIEGGCRWIELSSKQNDNATSLRDIALEIIPLCTEKDTFMTIDHDVNLVNDLKVHGVHLTPGDMLPKEAREFLGPHAVIGVTVSTPDEVIAFKSADIDYVRVEGYPEVSLDEYKQFVNRVREAGITTPIVAAGRISDEDIKPLLNAGVSGITISDAVVGSTDPTAYIKHCLDLTK
ncbi:MAG: thiamine phosphate synthase [Muribaculaceae bacterium]|nr:thiamine phosphate synthase [Muribaculaceae bacterium]